MLNKLKWEICVGYIIIENSDRGHVAPGLIFALKTSLDPIKFIHFTGRKIDQNLLRNFDWIWTEQARIKMWGECGFGPKNLRQIY